MPRDSLLPGLKGEATITVHDGNTAARIVDGAVSMFSTPSMIGLMEHASWNAVVGHLAEGESTVGTLVDIKHLAATPIGLEVTARAELVQVDGRRLRFRVEASDSHDVIGEGFHERFIITLERFLERASAKSPSAAANDRG